MSSVPRTPTLPGWVGRRAARQDALGHCKLPCWVPATASQPLAQRALNHTPPPDAGPHAGRTWFLVAASRAWPATSQQFDLCTRQIRSYQPRCKHTSLRIKTELLLPARPGGVQPSEVTSFFPYLSALLRVPLTNRLSAPATQGPCLSPAWKVPSLTGQPPILSDFILPTVPSTPAVRSAPPPPPRRPGTGRLPKAGPIAAILNTCPQNLSGSVSLTGPRRQDMESQVGLFRSRC